MTYKEWQRLLDNQARLSRKYVMGGLTPRETKILRDIRKAIDTEESARDKRLHRALVA